jgi:hypothetical protein
LLLLEMSKNTPYLLYHHQVNPLSYWSGRVSTIRSIANFVRKLLPILCGQFAGYLLYTSLLCLTYLCYDNDTYSVQSQNFVFTSYINSWSQTEATD